MRLRSRKEFSSSHTTKVQEVLSSYNVQDDIRKFAKIRLDAHGIDKENSVAGSNTVKKHGLASEVPGDIYYYAQQALALMKRLQTNKNDEDAKRDLRRVEGKIRMSTRYHKMNDDLPSDWKYNPATASTLVAKKCKPFQAKTKKIKEGPRNYPPVYDVPLDKEDQEIWMKFKKLDEAITARDSIIYPIQEKDVTVVKKDDIINTFISDFAIDAFNKCCQMYVNKNEDNYLRKAEIRRCTYHKLSTMYVFYMTILAIEQGILGIYETKVECGFHDGSRTLCMFVLTDRKPTVRGSKREKAIRNVRSTYETLEGCSSTILHVYQLFFLKIYHRKTHKSQPLPHRTLKKTLTNMNPKKPCCIYDHQKLAAGVKTGYVFLDHLRRLQCLNGLL